MGDILAKKSFRAKLSSGKYAGSKPVGSDCDKHLRRNYLVRINTTEKLYLPNDTAGVRLDSTFGAVLQYASVFIDGQPMAFAYVDRVKSEKDRSGRFGYMGTTYDLECILGLAEMPYYVPVAVLDEVEATLEREGLHFVLHNGEPFSEA